MPGTQLNSMGVFLKPLLGTIETAFLLQNHHSSSFLYNQTVSGGISRRLYYGLLYLPEQGRFPNRFFVERINSISDLKVSLLTGTLPAELENTETSASCNGPPLPNLCDKLLKRAWRFNPKSVNINEPLGKSFLMMCCPAPAETFTQHSGGGEHWTDRAVSRSGLVVPRAALSALQNYLIHLNVAHELGGGANSSSNDRLCCAISHGLPAGG